jgi:hypothetical protein
MSPAPKVRRAGPCGVRGSHPKAPGMKRSVKDGCRPLPPSEVGHGHVPLGSVVSAPRVRPKPWHRQRRRASPACGHQPSHGHSLARVGPAPAQSRHSSGCLSVKLVAHTSPPSWNIAVAGHCSNGGLRHNRSLSLAGAALCRHFRGLSGCLSVGLVVHTAPPSWSITASGHCTNRRVEA